MNNRLTIQDLAGLLAECTGKDRKSTELFLREFIAVISEGVCTDKIVKVKGLGTFKVILVEKRESIHVNTGERFLIPQHYKFSFLPDKDLRELVNKPFSFFETTELSDNVDFSDIDEQEQEDEKDSDDESVEELMPEREEPIAEEEPVSVKREEPSAEPVIEEQPTSLFGREPVRESGIQPTVKYLVAAVVVVVVVFIAGFYANKRLDLSASLKNNEATTETAVAQATIAEQTDTVAVADTSHNEVVTPDTVAAAPPPSSPQVLAKVKIEHGSRLTVIALEYYGSKVFWVYLYEYNKNRIGDPNNIPVGTEISVPSPEVYGINARDKASVAKAAALQTELLSGKQ